GGRLALAGVAIGVIVSFAAIRTLGDLLFGVGPTDPLTFGGVATLLTGVAILASYIPARRAMKVDPVTALKKGEHEESGACWMPILSALAPPPYLPRAQEAHQAKECGDHNRRSLLRGRYSKGWPVGKGLMSPEAHSNLLESGKAEGCRGTSLLLASAPVKKMRVY